MTMIIIQKATIMHRTLYMAVTFFIPLMLSFSLWIRPAAADTTVTLETVKTPSVQYMNK